MRRNRGNPGRRMAKNELEPCPPIWVGWRPKPLRGVHTYIPPTNPRPIKKSRVIMSEIKVDPNWVAFVPSKPPLGHRNAARKPKPKEIKRSNAEVWAAGSLPDRRWMKRHLCM
jgi:hypothetical protein